AFAAINEPAGTRHHELSRFLAATGHRVTVITSQASYLTGGSTGVAMEEIEPGVRIIRLPVKANLHKSFVHRLLNFFDFMFVSYKAGKTVSGVDLVWGTSPPLFQGITAWRLARRNKVKFLFEVRDLWPDFAIDVGVLKNPLLIKLSYWLEKFLYRKADTVIVNSPGYIEPVKSKGAKRVELVPNGSDPAMFTPKRSAIDMRHSYGIPEDVFVILYAGAHGISNDLETVLRSAHKLGSDGKVLFVLVGDGKEKRNLMSSAASMGLNNVRFIDSVAKESMGDVLGMADCCLAILKNIPMYRLTYPNKVFDYMAAGKPVILCIGGVIADLVEREGAGVMVPPGDPTALADAITKLQYNKDELSKMGESGKSAILREFNRESIANKLLRIVESLVGTKNG
ncbi:MAG TPA: glycosyltransferase family 4 protein, partial [Bellilinea sp.]|nr:glycosyltransferase family 4 protein [Bellilinea sp.]